jgi:hypothetical protein
MVNCNPKTVSTDDTSDKSLQPLTVEDAEYLRQEKPISHRAVRRPDTSQHRQRAELAGSTSWELLSIDLPKTGSAEEW